MEKLRRFLTYLYSCLYRCSLSPEESPFSSSFNVFITEWCWLLLMIYFYFEKIICIWLLFYIDSLGMLNSTHKPEEISHFHMTNYLLHSFEFVFREFCLVSFSYSHKILVNIFHIFCTSSIRLIWVP